MLHSQATSTSFSNFAYQVQMKLLNPDSHIPCGELFFRANSKQFYSFGLCTDGHGSFAIQDLVQGSTLFNLTNLNESNLITVIVKGDILVAYVNKQYVARLVDSSFSQGQIGVSGGIFSNAKVWIV